MGNEIHARDIYGSGVSKNTTVNVGAVAPAGEAAALRESIADLVARLEQCTEELKAAGISRPGRAGLERAAAAAASVAGIATAAETLRRTIEGLFS